MAKKRVADTKKAPNAPVGRRVEMAPNDGEVPTFYANNAMVEVSNFDVKLRMGLVTATTPEAITVRDLVHIYMAHDHFKAYVNALNTLVPNIDAMKAGTFKPQGEAE
jgi:hypothetical protein